MHLVKDILDKASSITTLVLEDIQQRREDLLEDTLEPLAELTLNQEAISARQDLPLELTIPELVPQA